MSSIKQNKDLYHTQLSGAQLISKIQLKTKLFMNNHNKIDTEKLKVNNLTNNIKDENENLKTSLTKIFEENGRDYTMKFDITDENYLTSNYTSLGTENIEYIKVPFQIIEKVIFYDIDSFI